MTNPEFREAAPKEFVSSDEHHWPRMQKSFQLLLIAAILLPIGIYLIANGLPDTSSSRARIIINGTPTIVGAFLMAFGCYGVVTAGISLQRKQKDAIDLKLRAGGFTVRGGLKIPWESVKSVTAIQYQNQSKLQLLWDRAELHRGLELELTQGTDLSAVKIRNGVPYVRISMVRYPAVDYRRLYDATLEQIERRGIPLTYVKKRMQT